MAKRIVGLEKLVKKLGAIDDLPSKLGKPAKEARTLVLKRAQHYPPPKPTYKRTFTLQRSWVGRWDRLKNGVRIAVYSTGANQGWGDYEQYVKGEGGKQAWMHQGYWDTVADDADAVTDDVLKLFEDEIRDIVRK